MNQPSSTITASYLATTGFTLLVALLNEVVGIPLSATLQGLLVAFAGAAVGYFWPEKVYPEGWKGNG